MMPAPNTEKQAKVYVVVRNQRLKEHVTYTFLTVFVVGFLILLFAFFTDMSKDTKYILGGLEAIFTPTVYLMSKHFYKSAKAAREADQIEGN